MLLENKVGIVTGAGSGIGRACAIRMAKEGCDLGLLDLSPEGLELTKQKIAEAAPDAKVELFVTDVSVEEQVIKAVRATAETFGKINVALNAAGVVMENGKVADLDSWRYEKGIAVNLLGMFYSAKAELKEMLANDENNAIVFIASTGGILGFDTASAYNSSKHGVVGLTKNLAVEYGEKNIRSNCICPEQCDTPLNDGNMIGIGLNENGIAKFKRTRNPMGRISQPEEIAAAVVWLLSEEASHVNGIILPVDGGQTCTNMNYFDLQ